MPQLIPGLPRILDHMDRCVCCGAHRSASCHDRCSFQLGYASSPGVVLILAALELRHSWREFNAAGVEDAIAAAERRLFGTNEPGGLGEAALAALGDYYTGQYGSVVSGQEWIRYYSEYQRLHDLGLHLYATAARVDGYDFRPDNFGVLTALPVAA
ncbi:hypothetical protein [Polymorphospora sp. NPDC050346]|uniref:hypothetical protein n=1 Tax=Polymorphospora sp. NPDC050346 TaxID=3155780 RepID=UPI0033E39E00